jgi:TDG/mug DNA glycosylase family protein
MEGRPGRLDDILALDLRILFVAINPAPLSLDVGHHFATPTNAFWKLLHASGVTSRLFRPDEAPLLPSEGIGLTSLVARATREAAELTTAEKRAGAVVLRRTVATWRPRAVALLGVTLFPVVFPDATDEAPGAGAKRVTLEGAKVFVLPNPSGRNRAYPGVVGKLPWYRELAEAVPRR